MLLIPMVTMLCTAGTAFYVRFLFALWQECKPRFTGHRTPKPPRVRVDKLSVHSTPPSKTFRDRAALQVTEIPDNAFFTRLGRGNI
jgi:hypothetical protein